MRLAVGVRACSCAGPGGPGLWLGFHGWVCTEGQAVLSGRSTSPQAGVRFIQPTQQMQKCLLCTGGMLETGGTEKGATRKNEEEVECSERDHTG